MADAVEIAAGLLRAREDYRALVGDRYEERVGPCRAAIRIVMEAKGLSAFEVVLGPVAQASIEGEDAAAAQLLAAAVDVAEGL